MSESVLVTVYITNYNYANYIEQSINSVLNQSFQNFELFIIDDGSIDNSREIIERYREDPRVTIIYQQNKGLNITNNVAMRASSGKYIMRLDADDFLEPKALEVMSSVLEDDDDLGLVFPDYYYVNAEGERTGEEKRHNFDKEVSLYDQPAHGACTMVRLVFLKKLGGYNESFTCQDGYELWIKFVRHHKVINVTQPLFSYRRHGNNLTTNEKRILDTRKKIKELFVDQNLKTHKTLVIIPVRSISIDGVNWPLYSVDGETVLERKVKVCLASKKITHVVISSADDEIIDFAKERFKNVTNVTILKRPKAFAQISQDLGDTIRQALSDATNDLGDFKAVLTVSLDYPFVNTDVIDDAINTLALFKSDAVLSVRPDNRMYYQHTGHSLKPILDQDKFTKLEREALYKGAGGVVISTVDNFNNNGNMVAGKISHIVVDQQCSFAVASSFDFHIYKKLMGGN